MKANSISEVSKLVNNELKNVSMPMIVRQYVVKIIKELEAGAPDSLKKSRKLINKLLDSEIKVVSRSSHYGSVLGTGLIETSLIKDLREDAIVLETTVDTNDMHYNKSHVICGVNIKPKSRDAPLCLIEPLSKDKIKAIRKSIQKYKIPHYWKNSLYSALDAPAENLAMNYRWLKIAMRKNITQYLGRESNYIDIPMTRWVSNHPCLDELINDELRKNQKLNLNLVTDKGLINQTLRDKNQIMKYLKRGSHVLCVPELIKLLVYQNNALVLGGSRMKIYYKEATSDYEQVPSLVTLPYITSSNNNYVDELLERYGNESVLSMIKSEIGYYLRILNGRPTQINNKLIRLNESLSDYDLVDRSEEDDYLLAKKGEMRRLKKELEKVYKELEYSDERLRKIQTIKTCMGETSRDITKYMKNKIKSVKDVLYDVYHCGLESIPLLLNHWSELRDIEVNNKLVYVSNGLTLLPW
ncbi:hypothetical protein GF352_00820 [archaeon]|nr:hypothetical protein [archaeon]